PNLSFPNRFRLVPSWTSEHDSAGRQPELQREKIAMAICPRLEICDARWRAHGGLLHSEKRNVHTRQTPGVVTKLGVTQFVGARRKVHQCRIANGKAAPRLA